MPFWAGIIAQHMIKGLDFLVFRSTKLTNPMRQRNEKCSSPCEARGFKGVTARATPFLPRMEKWREREGNLGVACLSPPSKLRHVTVACPRY
jgi:hypothetical protein